MYMCVCVCVCVNTCILGAYVNEHPDKGNSQSCHFRYATRTITRLTNAFPAYCSCTSRNVAELLQK